MKRLLFVGMIAALACGCDQLMTPPKSGNKSADSERTGKGDAVDTVVIQGGKIDAGRKAAKQIRDISAQRQNDLNGAMGD